LTIAARSRGWDHDHLEVHTMRGLSIALFLATTVLLGYFAAPSAAAPRHQALGDRLDLRDGDQSFPASTPFHVDHGFAFTIGDNTIGLSDFVLDMDGTPLTADFVRREPVGDGVTVSKLWYYNFPSGLSGTHEFTRHYFEACNDDTVPCDGNRINTPVEDLTVSALVTFIP
jgi:hypothetical protein